MSEDYDTIRLLFEELMHLKSRYDYLKSIGPTEFKGIYGEVLCGEKFDACIDKRIRIRDQQDAIEEESHAEKALGL